MFAHTGTHMDAPWHFIDDGYKIEDFPIESFVFSRVLFIEIQAESWQPVPVDALQPYETELKDADCLLIYTGFSRYRAQNKEEYIEATPGLSVELAEYLSRFPRLVCVGVDFISIENVANGRKTGFPVHHALLGGETQRILLEDADLSCLKARNIAKVYLFPLRMVGLEASPVTAVAELA
jgi:kynurenine formamidase